MIGVHEVLRHPLLGSELPQQCATSDTLRPCPEHQGREAVVVGPPRPRTLCVGCSAAVLHVKPRQPWAWGSVAKGLGLGRSCSGQGAACAWSRRVPPPWIAAPAQTGMEVAEGRIVADGSHGPCRESCGRRRDHPGRDTGRGTGCCRGLGGHFDQHSHLASVGMARFRQLGHERGGPERTRPGHAAQQPGLELPDRAAPPSTKLSPCLVAHRNGGSPVSDYPTAGPLPARHGPFGVCPQGPRSKDGCAVRGIPVGGSKTGEQGPLGTACTEL